jgi:hypothetical protein
MRFIGMGDNVVDRYINKEIMFPGGNAVNFAVYAKNAESIRLISASLPMIRMGV